MTNAHEIHILRLELDKLHRKMKAGDNLTYDELHREANLRSYIAKLESETAPVRRTWWQKLRDIW